MLDRVREAIRIRHYSPRTEQAYVHWIRRYIFFHKIRHPADMGTGEINAFLSHLAVTEHVSASTQTQALSALAFLYRHVLGRDIGLLEGVVRAKRPGRVPVVLSPAEVSLLLRHLQGVVLLVCTLLYGSGLRLLECLHLRVCWLSRSFAIRGGIRLSLCPRGTMREGGEEREVGAGRDCERCHRPRRRRVA